MAEHARAESAGAKVAGRVVVYALLTLVAAYYLLPLFVMLTTSVTSLDEIRDVAHEGAQPQDQAIRSGAKHG